MEGWEMFEVEWKMSRGRKDDEYIFLIYIYYLFIFHHNFVILPQHWKRMDLRERGNWW